MRDAGGVLGSRVVVVGPPGAGKSTFSQELAGRLGVDHFERDGAGQLGSDAYREAVAALVRRSAWVFDGFPYFCDSLVYAAADSVIALRYGRGLVLRRVLVRSLRLRGRPIGAHAQAPWRAWLASDHALRVAVRNWAARIAEIDALASRPELAGKPTILLRSPPDADRVLARIGS